MKDLALIGSLLLLTVVKVQYGLELAPHTPVQCFIEDSNFCSGSYLSNSRGGEYIPAGDCCIRRNGTFIKLRENGDFDCLHCLTAGFNVSSLAMRGRGTKRAISVQVRSGYSSALSSLSLGLSITPSDSHRPISQILYDRRGDLLSRSSISFSRGHLSRVYLFEIREKENGLALEPDANYTFMLNLRSTSPQLSAFFFGQREFHLSIADPDPVYVSFTQPLYRFTDSSTGSITLQRVGRTASQFSVTLTCDGLFDSRVISVPASTDDIVDISVPITAPSLSTQVNYTLRISSVSNFRVSVTPHSTSILQVQSTRSIVYVGFSKRTYSFSESASSSSATIDVAISSSVLQSLKVRIRGGPGAQPQTVAVSGVAIDRVIEFTSSGSLTQSISLSINDDSIGLETIEAYSLSISLVNAPDSSFVTVGNVDKNLYGTTIISIVDDEVVTAQMERSAVAVRETSGSVRVCAILSNPAVTGISLIFSTKSQSAIEPNDYIGGSQRRVVAPSLTSTCVSYSIVQDNIIEQNETFSVDLSLAAIISNRLQLNNQLRSTAVTIIDTNIQPIEVSCMREIDVMFILDSSGSVGQDNFTAMIDFVTTVAQRFQFGQARFGVVTFSSDVSLDITLGEHGDFSSFKAAVTSLSYKARTTSTAEAIQLTSDHLEARGRSSVPHAIILFTDGRSDDPPGTLTQAMVAKDAGIRILTIGIGPRIDLAELRGVASPLAADNVFLINSFSRDDFALILAPIVRETCEVLVGFSQPTYMVSEDGQFIDVTFQVLNGTLNRDVSIQFTFSSGTARVGDDFNGVMRSFTLSPSQSSITTRFAIINDEISETNEFFTASISTRDEFVKVTVPTTRVTILDDDDESCGGEIDLIAVLDSSGSIRIDDFEKVKEFVSMFSNEFQVSPDKARFGVITFSNEANLDIELGSINTPNGFRQAVVQIPFRPGRTNTAAAIELARQQFIQNGREGVPHAIVLITDGLSNDKDATIQAAVNARGNGIEIFAIGVGAGVDSDELNAIATDPDSTHVSLLNSFSAQTLGSILKPLAQRVCTPVCQRQIDFMLVMDPAVNAANFNSVKQFFISLVAQFTIGPDAAQFGVVSYTSTDAMLGAKDDEDSLQMAITDIDFSPGVIRNTAVSINAAREQFILNGRTGVPKVLILVTSGPLSSSSRAVINTLRESGLEIFIVSSAEQVVADGVQSFTVSEFGSQSFSGILGDVVRESCNVPVCSTPPLDIIFALDGSTSVGSENFINLLNFVVDITNQYTIDRTRGTQVGVVVFATTAQRTISLPQFQTRADLSNAIIDIDYPGGGTSTNLAIKQAREEFSINGRSEAKRVLIVATDGRSNNPVATSEQARLARSEDIEIFSVGIGSGANVDELNDVASDPSSAHVFTIANYSAQSLASVSQSLTTGICQEPVACSRLADAVFIIDSSVTPQDFPNVQQFIINAASQLDIRQSAIRIAIVQSTASVVLRLNDIRDSQAFINAVRSLSHNPTGITDLIAGIELAQSELRANGRTGAAQLIYVITARNTPLTISPSVDDSISLIAIGTSQNVLRSISSRVVAINDFALASLQSIQDATVDRICTQSPHCSLNIIFVLEASSSISSASFQLMLNYITRIVNQFEVSSTGSQVGVITFSNTAVSSIDIGSISGNSDIAQAIASIQQLASSGRRVDLAFGIAEAQLSSLSSSNRNVVFLITTGVSSNSVATINTVGLLNSLGDVEIFAVGVSSSISNEFRSELFEISTKQSGSRDFLLSSFNSLGGIFNSIIREFCDDDSSVQRDPVFAVPLNGPPDMPMLCYEVYGAPNKSFNLISDKCISINAHYTERVALARHRPLHLIDRFGFKIVSSITNNCIDVLVEVTASGLLKTTLNGRVISNKLVVGDVHVTSTDQHFMFTSNNCANGLVAIAVQRKSIHQVGYLEMQLESGKGLTTTSHGLIGQFCNASVKVHSQGIELRDNHWSGSDSNNYRVMEFSSSDGSLLKRVPAILRSRTWGAEDVPCLYAGDSEGGRMYEVSSPNDPLIDGSYKDYITSSLFSPDFKYNQFNDKLCTSGVM